MLFLLFLSVLGIVYSLLRAAYIDLRTRILPNELIISFVVFGCALHVALYFSVLSYTDMLVGGLFSFTLMTLIRVGAGYYYKREAFGQGDVKLLSAAGIWLGMEYFLVALILGALAGIIHGLVLAQMQAHHTGERPKMNQLMMPAGPGFVAGILLTGIYMYSMPVYLTALRLAF